MIFNENVTYGNRRFSPSRAATLRPVDAHDTDAVSRRLRVVSAEGHVVSLRKYREAKKILFRFAKDSLRNARAVLESMEQGELDVVQDADAVAPELTITSYLQERRYSMTELEGNTEDWEAEPDLEYENDEEPEPEDTGQYV